MGMVPLRLISATNPVSDVYYFEFERPRGFEWDGGQHVSMLVEHENADERGISRALSIATAPHERTVGFLTHCPENGSTFKKALRSLRPGHEVRVTSPQGRFTAADRQGRTIFLVGGVGIGAVRAILRQLDHAGEPLRGALIYHAEDGAFVWLDELRELAARHPGFKVVPVKEGDLSEVGGIKEVERREDDTYYFSGVYTQDAIEAAKLKEGVEGLRGVARDEVEALTKLTGLVG